MNKREDKSDKDDNEQITWHVVAETNDWEGEIWYHYFQYAEGVKEALESVDGRGDLELESDTETLSWKQAETLANCPSGYIDIHWFGRLVDFEGLAKATDDELYKGGIRNYGEELFDCELQTKGE